MVNSCYSKAMRQVVVLAHVEAIVTFPRTAKQHGTQLLSISQLK